ATASGRPAVPVRGRRLALQPARLVDDPLEQPRQRLRSERPADGRAVRAHVRQHLRLALRLIDLEPELLLDLADAQRTPRALVQQLHEALVELVNPAPQLVDRHGRAPARTGPSVSDRT